MPETTMSPQRKKLSMRNKNIAPVSNKLKKNLTGPKKEKFIKIYRVSFKNNWPFSGKNVYFLIKSRYFYKYFS